MISGPFARGATAAALLLLAGPSATTQTRTPDTHADAVVTSLTLFAGTAEGLWRSRDWGGSWQRVEGRGAEALEGFGAVRALQPLGPQVYAAGDGGVALSDDFGQTWLRVSESRSVTCVMASRFPQADPTVFIGTDAGLFRSTDAGRHFKPTALIGTAVHRLEWPGPALVAATGGGVRLSVDAGDTFTPAGAGLPAGDVQAIAVSSFFVMDPVLFAAPGAEGVFRSSDGGRTWTAAGLTGRRASDLVWLGPLLYAATDDGVHRSEDAGAHWMRLDEGLRGVRATRLLFPLAPDVGAEVFLGTESGLFRSTDGGQHWSASGLAGRAVLTVATFPSPPRSAARKGRR
ncbi:MAG TPA: hypothetical protein VGL15_07385 [Vicinamibacteria bacterium]